jgi:hypothetical protein
LGEATYTDQDFFNANSWKQNPISWKVQSA